MNKSVPNIKPNPTPLNKHQGGSYTRNPETGELTLVAQTKQAESQAPQETQVTQVTQATKAVQVTKAQPTKKEAN